MQNATKLKMVGSIGLEPMYLVREMDLQSTVIAAIRTPRNSKMVAKVRFELTNP
jgi:hypothetical protein